MDRDIFSSIAENNVDRLQEIISLGGDVNLIQENGLTPLILAASLGNLAIVKTLIEASANVDRVDINGISPLMLAANEGFFDIFNYLAPLTSSELKEVGFIAATLDGNIATVKAFVDSGIDVNAYREKGMENDRGRTALTIAIQRGNSEKYWEYSRILELLLKAGANPNSIDEDSGDTPLIIAIEHCNYRAIELLWRVGAKIDLKNDRGKDALTIDREVKDFGILQLLNDLEEKEYKFFDAIFTNDLATIRALIAEGIDIDRFDRDDDDTPLMTAIRFSSIETIELLIEAGADVNCCNYIDFDCDPLGLAVDRENLEIVKLLLAAGAKPNYGGYLNSAIRKGNIDLVITLLEAGASLDIWDEYDDTPLMAAATKGDIEMVRFLVDLGANITQGGYAALYYAADEGNLEVFTYLFDLIENDPRQESNFTQTILIETLKEGNEKKLFKQSILYLKTRNFQKIRQAIDSGLYLGYKDEKGRNLLIHAIEQGCIEAVQMLLEAGMDANTKDKQGNTALRIAINNSNLDLWYVDRDFNLLRKNIYSQIVQILLDAGARDSQRAIFLRKN